MSDKVEINSLAGEIFAKDGLNWVLSGGKIWKAASVSAAAVFVILLLIVFLKQGSLSNLAIIKLLQTSMTIFILLCFSSLFFS